MSCIDNNSVKEAVTILRHGGLIAFPTETVYALACDAKNPHAIKRIYGVKGRDAAKPLSLLASSIKQIEQIAKLNEQAYKLLAKFAPGPLTIVVKISKEFNFCLTDNVKKTIGIRIPKHQLALDLINSFGQPIIATSANLSGEIAATTASEVQNQLGDKIDLLIDGGKCAIGISSTVVDVSGETIKILRQGTITKEDIINCL